MNHYKKILNIFQELQKSHPKYTIGKHIATIVEEHNVWGINNERFLKILKEYQSSLDMDLNHTDDDIEKIIEGGLSLDADNIYEEEEWQ